MSGFHALEAKTSSSCLRNFLQRYLRVKSCISFLNRTLNRSLYGNLNRNLNENLNNSEKSINEG